MATILASNHAVGCNIMAVFYDFLGDRLNLKI